MLSDSAKVEDVPISELLQEVRKIVPPTVRVSLYVSALQGPEDTHSYSSAWGYIGDVYISRLSTVCQVLNVARRESDRIQSQRLRDELDSKAAAEIAGMA